MVGSGVYVCNTLVGWVKLNIDHSWGPHHGHMASRITYIHVSFASISLGVIILTP